MQTKRLIFAALLSAACSLASAGEQPGLEIFDAGGVQPGPVVDYQPAPSPIITFPPDVAADEPLPPVIVPDSGTYIDPYDQPVTTTIAPEPVADPFTDPYASDPFAPTTEDGFQPDPFQDPYGEITEPVAGEAPVVETAPIMESVPLVFIDFYPDDPVQATLADINTYNSFYPGMGEAAAAGDIASVGAIVWETLKGRRILDATLQRGPGASVGYGNAQDLQRIIEISQYIPTAETDSPLAAAGRINTVLDTFAQPIIENPVYGSTMSQLIVRLHSDIVAILGWLRSERDAAVHVELSRTYIRAATTCDFFAFTRNALATDINTMYERASSLFYPDGASIGGDVGGVTGNMLGGSVMLYHYTRDDNRFRRSLRRVWSSMERPARYALDLALPDMTLPRFGPRGTRELSIEDVMRLNEMFPRRPHNRIGLASTFSYPPVSGQNSYGGIFATRSGPESTGRYMAVRFGPLGIMPGVPAHRDFGSLELMSRGVKFIVDGGGFGGASTMPEAHSNLSLDGQYVIDAGYNPPEQPVGTIWRTNAGLDFASDLGTFADGKTWQRTVVYVKDLPGEALSDYWVVLDHVDMKNDNQPRQARIRYQLAPGVQAYHDGSGMVATANYADGSALRLFAIDGNTELSIAEGGVGVVPSFVHDSSGGEYPAPSIVLSRSLVGDTTTATLLYPSENMNHRPARIERDADLIRGRTGAIVVDHGHGRVDVIAWAPPGTELVTPTLNLQMSADLGVFRLRNNKLSRVSFINLERFQAKEPDGGMWSMRVNGPAQTLTLEPEANGGWQVLSDPANQPATLYDVRFGPSVSRRNIQIRPGDLRVVPR